MPDLDVARIQALIKALRSPMPPNFRWRFNTLHDRFSTCGTVGCALGLAEELWGREAVSLSEPFGMSNDAAERIFYNCHPTEDQLPFYGCPSYYVRPEMVAAALEDYLACRKEPSHGE